MEKIAIVGAGMCGLTLSRLLSAASKPAFLIEKSKSVGGRLATRRDGDATFDHGAAFYVDSGQDPLVWHRRWQESKKSLHWFSEDARKYFCGAKGMTTLAKDLAEGEKIQLNEKVLSFKISENEIIITCQSGQLINAQKIVLTCPLPQSLQILKASEISFPESLKSIAYAPAIVGLFEMKADPDLYNLNLLRPGSSIFTIANNQSKGISKNLALTVVMNDLWSEKNFELEDPVILQMVQTELQKFFKGAAQIQKAQIKKWRYSQPTSCHPEPFVSLADSQIFLAGDAFGGGSLAGAARSANAVFSFL